MGKKDLFTKSTAVTFLGDTHGNDDALLTMIERGVAEQNRMGNKNPLFIHVGDAHVGFPGWTERVKKIHKTLARNNAHMIMVRGNHDNPNTFSAGEAHPKHGGLRKFTSQIFGVDGPQVVTLAYGKKIALVGGAVSVNQLNLTEGVDWFSGEELSREETRKAIESFPKVDVMVSHDCPSSFDIHGWESGRFPEQFEHDSAVVRDRLQQIMNVCEPGVLYHGHYHMPQKNLGRAAATTCLSVGLGKEAAPGSWETVHLSTMR